MSRQIISDTEAYGIIIFYNLLAFGTQPWTGRWVDESAAESSVLKLAVVLLVGGALTSSLFSPSTLIATTAVFLLGMGNSLFHVYGGRYVAVASHHDIRAMGVFVSTGTVGLAIGLGFSSSKLIAAFVLTFLVLSSLHIYSTCKQHAVDKVGRLFIRTAPKRMVEASTSSIPFLFLACLMLVVAGRAFICEFVPAWRTSAFPMSASQMMVVVSIIVLVGKVSGGFLAKWCGVRKVFYGSLLISAASSLMFPLHHIFVPITLFLINLSMPCTLYLATKAVPGREGWAFGLLALALLPGFLLGNLTKGNNTSQALLTPLMATILLECCILLYCLHEYQWQVLAASVLLNIITNIPLNAFVMAYGVETPLSIVGLECAVVAVEAFGYWLVLHNLQRAFMYSFLCNSFSALVGYFFNLFLLDYLAC